MVKKIIPPLTYDCTEWLKISQIVVNIDQIQVQTTSIYFTYFVLPKSVPRSYFSGEFRHGNSLYSASQKKQNPETMECCEQVVGCMTIIIYISWIMINMLSNDT